MSIIASFFPDEGTECACRLASRKFMHEALHFTRFVKEQMGVEIFMLAGWTDEQGKVKKAKYVSGIAA